MTVITGTDGSERAERAVSKAGQIAAALGEPLVVVCVYRVSAEGRGLAGDDGLAPSEHAGVLANASARRVMAEFPGLSADGRAYQGKPAEGILRAAEAVEADLIVVGNLRVQGGSRVLGSIATEIARHATCDVYIAHTQA